jgi:hypothetical protein
MATLSQFSGGTTLPIDVDIDSFNIDALVVGGGGIGSAGSGAGGGRVVQAFGVLIKKGVTYNITVGNPGQNSVFGAIIAQAGGSSGFGGGSGAGGSSGSTVGGLAIFPTVGTYTVNSLLNVSNIISSGNNGGGASGNGGPRGGGGGAGGAGSNTTSNLIGGAGGAGLISQIKGPGSYYYGAGQGGINGTPNAGDVAQPGPNGLGAGGANTGTGGQSGVVVVAYPNTFALATVTGSHNLYTGGTATRIGYHVYEFTGNGSITF